jgi:hypothetical protein
VSSADIGTIRQEKVADVSLLPAWLWLGIGVYALLLINGNILLGDSDTYWHIAVGRWILDHGAFPHTDIYSFTKTGEPWVSSSWLAQVMYASAYDWAGWPGPIVLAAAAIAAAFALLAFILGRHIPTRYAVLIPLAALLLSGSHLLARPHVLVFPVMVAWASGLLRASERGASPSYWLLPVLALWANLHGGFVFGLALVAPFALDALWNADASQRKSLTMRWFAFGLAALVACCVTPYGWGSILASRRILDLGELLRLIYEWMPADFSRVTPLEVSVLAAIAGALYCGVRLTPPRIILVLGLLHMALSHVRNIEIFALLAPLVMVGPLSAQFAMEPARFVRKAFPVGSAAVAALILVASTWAFAANHPFTPPANQAPAAAVEVLKAHNAKRIMNDLPFAGYLISQGIPVFIDGRAELYGEPFEMAYYRAVQLRDVGLFLDLLKTYDIDAVLLTPETPAATLLDHIGGWQRVYSDENAVVHIRTSTSSRPAR